MCKKKTISKLFLGLTASILFLSCKSQVSDSSLLRKIKVEFVVNDSSCIIDSTFEIMIKKGNDSVLYENKAIDGAVLIPDSIWGDTDYFNVVVKYSNGYSLAFDSVSALLVRPTEGMDWKFGVEKKPFLVVGSIIHPDMTKNDPDLKAIYFWKLRPYEGHGRQIIKKVY